jgi:hypothetical protein
VIMIRTVRSVDILTAKKNRARWRRLTSGFYRDRDVSRAGIGHHHPRLAVFGRLGYRHWTIGAQEYRIDRSRVAGY